MPGGTSEAGLAARLAALVARAAGEAGRTGEAVLVSVTREVGVIDPLAALNAAANAARADPAVETLLQSGRMYWSHRPSRHEFAAIGAAAVVSPDPAHRFAQADASWRRLLATAMTDAPHDDVGASVGPVLVGGFAFDPRASGSALWRAFPAAHLIVPAVCVSVRQARHFLTASLLVTPDGDNALLPVVLRLHDALVAMGDARLAAAASPGSASPSVTLAPVLPVARWRALVELALDRISAGEFRKVVLARAEGTVGRIEPDVLAILARLRASYTQAYVFAYWRDAQTFLGATPERLVRVTGRLVEASSLAGSAPRGGSAAEDALVVARLARSEKDLSEHALVLESLRRDLRRVADEVVAPDAPTVLTLPNVHHLHTAVRGRLRPGHSALTVAGALHPTPAVGGAPRAPALEFIRAHEELDRGWYAAPVGWIGRHDGELAVALRSALVSAHDATLFAGCGIVRGSDPDAELAESIVKLHAMEGALGARGDEADLAADATLGAPLRASVR